MYAIKMPDGNYLEGRIDIAFELNNQVFSTSDAGLLPGSYSFPADVPLTPANKVALGHPHLANNASQWKTFPGVWVECYGIKMFYGKLRISGCNSQAAKIEVVANHLAGLKEKTLDSLTLGGARSWSGSLANHMKATARLPEDWDYAFFPVFTADTPDAISASRYQNKYDTFGDVFDTSNTVVTPFVRLDYLLPEMFAECADGFAFQNKFQTTTELGRLYVYNNLDARLSLNDAAPTLPTSLSLGRHLPAEKCADFLKKLVAQWCLGLFTNIFSRRISLVPMRDVLARPAARNWTQYVEADAPLESAGTVPTVFVYPDQDAPPGAPAPHLLPHYKTVAEFANAASTLPVGYYYVESETCVFHIIAQIPGTTYQEQHYVHRGVYLDSEERPFQGVMGAIFDGQNYCRTVSGISRYRPEDNGFGGTEYRLEREDAPVALLLYRGWQSDDPKSRNHPWDPNSDPATRSNIYTDNVAGDISEVSLLWSGEYGLYERWHKTWNDMLRTGKHVTMRLHLPIGELVAFSFEDKIRIGSMDYFVKKMRISTPLGHGLVRAEASLVTVI